MKTKLLQVLTISLIFSFRVFATDVDLNDEILTAYPLSPMDEADFSLTDGNSAFFWEQWNDLDHIEMNVNDNAVEGWEPFDGPDDAAMVIKAAYSLNGLYLFIKVNDNTWVPPADFSDIGCDAVDLYFDSRTQEEIKNTPNEEMATPWSNALTKTTKQMLVWMGSNKVNYHYYNEVTMNWLGVAVLGGSNVITFEEAQDNYDGLGMEILEETQNVRIQEWFLPWSELGIDINPFPENGMKFAFSGGYNDKDEVASEQSSLLRWLKHDPWSLGPRENPDDPTSPVIKVGECECPQWALESWGHIYLPFPPIGEGTGVQYFTQKQKMDTQVQSTSVVKTEYFTLHGKKIPHHSFRKLRPNTMVIERILLSDGSSKVKRTQLKTR